MDETQPLLSTTQSHRYGDEPQLEAVLDITAFNPDGDADNPLEWPKSYRWGVILLLAFMAFTV
jgi:hypothetical protein